MMKKGKLEQWTPLPNLPSEILEDVLSRLPVDALCRFRCVSKSWRDLITDRRFIKIHLRKSMRNNPKIIVSSGYRFFSVDFEGRDETSAMELNHSCHQPLGHVEIVGCCHGLICFRDRFSIYVWNPATRDHIKLRNDFSDRATISTFLFVHLGFGYDPITGEYKVITIGDFGYGNKEYRTRVFVRTLTENSWRRLGSTPYQFYTTTGELLNGAVHWVARNRDRTRLIVSFDFRDEKFREIMLPDFVDERKPLRIALLVRLLCIWSQIKDCFEIWVMKKYGDENSWTKQFSLLSWDIDYFYLKPLGFRRTGEILLQDGQRRLTLYDPVNKRIRDLCIHGIPKIYEVHNHLESLVSPMAGNILQEK